MSDDVARIRALEEEVDSLYKQGRYREALPLAEKAAASARPMETDQPHVYAACLSVLGEVQRVMGMHGEAELSHQRAVELWKGVVSHWQAQYALAVNNLGLLYQEMGDYRRAEPLCCAAVAAWKEALGEDHRLYATALNNLGLVYQEMGQYARAESLLSRAMEIRQQVLGEHE